MAAYSQQQPTYSHLNSTAAATANSIAAARYGAYTSSYQRPYMTGTQHTPYLPQQAGYNQIYSVYHQQPQIPLNQTPAKQEDEASPDGVTSSSVLRSVVTGLLLDAGFTGSETQPLILIEKEVIAVVERLYKEAQGYASVSQRPSPSILDLAQVFLDNGLTPSNLRRALRKGARKRKRNQGKSITLGDSKDRETSPDLLGSDDENAIPHIPPTLRYMPPHFPPLPPRHSYLRTPVAATTKKALPSLEKKLANASLVQESLKSLIIATEDTQGPEDADLVGHVVNWENAASARKRWRLH